MVTLSWTTTYATADVWEHHGQHHRGGHRNNYWHCTGTDGERDREPAGDDDLHAYGHRKEHEGRTPLWSRSGARVNSGSALCCPRLRSFVSDPPDGEVTEGEEFTLTWIPTAVTTSVTITADTGGTVTKPAGDLMAKFTLNRLGMTVYSLRSTGPGGSVDHGETVTVDVSEAPLATATLTYAVAAEDQLTTTVHIRPRRCPHLDAVADAKEFTLTANGVSIPIETDLEEGAAMGTETENPLETTTYTLTATSTGQNPSSRTLRLS